MPISKIASLVGRGNQDDGEDATFKEEALRPQSQAITVNRIALLMQDMGYRGKVVHGEDWCWAESASNGNKFSIYAFSDQLSDPNSEARSIQFDGGWGGLSSYDARRFLMVCNRFNHDWRYAKATVATDHDRYSLSVKLDHYCPNGLTDEEFCAVADMYIRLIEDMAKRTVALGDDTFNALVERHNEAVGLMWGADSDPRRALCIYLANARSGYGGSMHSLGDLYEHGAEVSQSAPAAAYFFAQAAERGRPSAYYGLSKSRITAFEQCPKKLWLSVHRRELAEVQAQSELRFAAGHEVGAIACELAPGGAMIEAQPDLTAALKQTSELLVAGHRAPIYEATFAHDGVLIQADVLEPVGERGWRIAEVKSSTAVKDYHRGDLATQIWVLENCGIKLEAAVIRHIDTSFVLRVPGDYRGLLKDAALLEEVRSIVAVRDEVAESARETLAGPEPIREMGTHCTKPFSCEFQAYCGKDMPPPPEWPVDILPRASRNLIEEMTRRGISDLRDVPLDALKKGQHKVVLQATVSALPYHDHAGVMRETKDWAFPRHYLDFETIALPVPAWVGAKPYQQVPFQFSCHTELADGTITHRSFLSADGADPRRACAEALIECVGQRGAIIAYNASFERSCVRGLADALPDMSLELTAIAERFVDLLPVAQAHYYHRDQRGSWSIKKVLPTIAPDLDYSDLEVGDGAAAQLAWFEAASAQCEPERRAQIAASLEAYCERDTWAMVVLLRRMTGSSAVTLERH